MSLSDYKKKRSFDKTPEPAGKPVASSKAKRFVVQKHDASHLHYDFRLEMEGVLKSWAVPKGPSLNPKDKRLAMMVEDHPYDYKDFEGIIPKGNYGAGTVIVWDEGTYEPAESTGESGKGLENVLLHQLHKGNLRITLHGKKLKGEFALVHTSNSNQENAWLLIKKQDEHAADIDITTEDRSVISGKTIDEVAANTGSKKWISNRSSDGKLKNDKEPADDGKKRPGKKNKAPASEELTGTHERSLEELLQSLKELPALTKSKFPDSVQPMLASLIKKPFDDEGWVFEVKWDGYRAIAAMNKGDITLQSRNKLSFAARYPPIMDALKQWNVNAVVDGEIIVLNESGGADFQKLQAWQKAREGNLAYYLFDILWLDGYSTVNIPLLERKEILKQIVPEDSIIRYSDHIVERGKDFFALSLKSGLEGVMAKKADSGYSPGTRSQQWLKIKTHQTQEAVIAGFTEGRGGRKNFGALILGVYDGKELLYIGHTGSGMDDKALAAIFKKLQPLVTDQCPFKKKPKTNMPAVWVEPKLVCEVKYQEWTKDNILRIPILLGLREDKKPTEVKREEPISIEDAKNDDSLQMDEPAADKAAKKATSKKEASSVAAAKKSTRQQQLLPSDQKEFVVDLNGHQFKVSNLDKLYWKQEKITKRDMLNYYYQVMPYMLPYMKNRPQSLNRHPEGIEGESFYMKNVTGKVAPWLKTYKYTSDSDGLVKNFLVCTDEASLLYIANLGCIEMNPWHSRIESPENPDWCVIDLDPDNTPFEKVIETANVVKKILDALHAEAHCKTSGSTGLHIYIPLGAKYSYDQSRQFAELIVNLVHNEIPSFTSLERSPAKRKGLIYLDYLQNRSIQTIASPYSLRPKPGATVSTPLHWEEVKKGLAMSSFTIFNILDRIKNEGDLFKGVLGKGIDLNKVLEKAASLF